MSVTVAPPAAPRDLHVVLVHPEIHGNTGSSLSTSYTLIIGIGPQP